MKKLFLSIAVLFAMGVVLNSCGDDASGDADKKSACDCMKEVMESEGKQDKAPAGCEWMDKLEDKEMMDALKDCPEMAGMFEMEMPDMPDMDEMPEMPDMDDMPEMPDMDDMPEMPDMPDMK